MKTYTTISISMHYGLTTAELFAMMSSDGILVQDGKKYRLADAYAKKGYTSGMKLAWTEAGKARVERYLAIRGMATVSDEVAQETYGKAVASMPAYIRQRIEKCMTK